MVFWPRAVSRASALRGRPQKGTGRTAPKITTPSGAGTAPGGTKTVGFIGFGAPGGPGSQKNSGFYMFFGPKRPQEPPLSPETSDQGWAWPPLVSTKQNSWHRFGTTFFQILKISNSLQKKLIGNFWKIFELCNQSLKKLITFFGTGCTTQKFSKSSRLVFFWNLFEILRI